MSRFWGALLISAPMALLGIAHTASAQVDAHADVEPLSIEVSPAAPRRSIRPADVLEVKVEAPGVATTSGKHPVQSDGTVNLDAFGRVHVEGATLAGATLAIETQVKRYLASARVTVDLAGHNTKFYYVIIRQAGAPDREVRLPLGGGETVLDAVGQMSGLADFDRKKFWLERTNPVAQQLPIQWDDIVKRGIQTTNYRIQPDDRLFIADRDPKELSKERFVLTCAVAMPAILFGLTICLSLVLSLRKSTSGELL